MSDLKQRLIDMANDFKSRDMFNNEANALKALERIIALEAALKPFADAWNVYAKHHNHDALFRCLSAGQLGRLAAGETAAVHFQNAASLLEAKPATPSVEHITGVALRETTYGTTWVCGRPNRHHDVIALMARDTANPFHDSPHDCQQGFYTSNERFVTRLEAMQIAKAAGQLIRPASGGYQGPELFSEDLW